VSNIVFVSPTLSLEEQYGKLAFGGSTEALLGLCYLAACTREKGHGTWIVDMQAMGLGYQEAVDKILENDPECVGITSVTLAIGNAYKLAGMIKARDPRVTIIIGGAHVTAVPEETMSRYADGFDVGVVGEGERTITELLEAIEGGKPLDHIRGIIFHDKSLDKFKYTERIGLVSDLDDLPMPAWDLLPDISKHYIPTTYAIDRLPSFSLVTTRGCAFKCTFCDRSVFGNKYRKHSPGYIISMLKDLYFNYGIRDIRFNDDEFMLSKTHLSVLCESILKEKLDITWSCLARVDSVTYELLTLMRRSGCRQIRFGIESGSQSILDEIKKGITIDDVRKAVSMTKKAGIRTIGFFMMALPGETMDTIRETVDFAKELDLDDFKMNYYAPFPGSQLYKDIDKYGTADLSWEKMNMHTRPSFLPHGLTEEQLIKMNKYAFRSFYLRPKVIFSYIMRTTDITRLRVLIKGVIALLNFWLRK